MSFKNVFNPKSSSSHFRALRVKFAQLGEGTTHKRSPWSPALSIMWESMKADFQTSPWTSGSEALASSICFPIPLPLRWSGDAEVPEPQVRGIQHVHGSVSALVSVRCCSVWWPSQHLCLEHASRTLLSPRDRGHAPMDL